MSRGSCASCPRFSPTFRAPKFRSIDRCVPSARPSTDSPRRTNLVLLALAARHLEAGECYLEAGTYRGRSLIGAALGSTATCVAIDNFSFDDADPAGLAANVERFGVGDRVRVIDGDTVAALQRALP